MPDPMGGGPGTVLWYSTGVAALGHHLSTNTLPGLVHALQLPDDTVTAAAVDLGQSGVVTLCCGLLLPAVWSHIMLQGVVDGVVGGNGAYS